tara:strand:- start:1411 stop:2319 length:909 start_codon:yes stop_codon:yes gene_type:complete
MAEQNTFTVDTTPQTETVISNDGSTEGLTPDEQDSLAVGEEITAQQENLLAGKYKSAEELEKAYVELQSKLGEKSESDSTKPEAETEPVEQESSEEPVLYLEDGGVNYEQVNASYGEKLGDIFKSSNVDPWEISEHFHSNNGTITNDMYSKLEGAGLSRASIDSYLAGRAVESGYTTVSNDIPDSAVSEVQASVGGEDSYKNIINWAGSNLDQPAIEAFDNIINSGSVEAIKIAVSGLKAQYENANGYEGKMYTGKAPTQTSDVFRSQAELVKAMSDRRYDDDPAYRQDVIAKLDRSDNLQF